LYHDFPKSRIIASESPDFILQISRKHRIGVEVAHYAPSTHAGNEQVFLNPIDLKASIVKKEQLFASYADMSVNEYWLLLVINGLPKRLSVRFPANYEFFVPESCLFNKLFILDLAETKLLFPL